MAGETSSTTKGADRWNALLEAYRQVCASYHAVDDFRAKLLAALPIVSGTGGILLLANAGPTVPNSLITQYLGKIGLFGTVVTLGLWAYEIRGHRNCHELTKMGRWLESELELTTPKAGEHTPKAEEPKLPKLGQFQVLEPRLTKNISLPLIASVIVYGATLAGWGYITYVGSCRL